MYRIILNECVYCVVYTIYLFVWEQYLRNIIIVVIMSISLIHILIISVHVWGYSSCYLFMFYSSVCVKYIGTMYGVCVSNRCILL